MSLTLKRNVINTDFSAIKWTVIIKNANSTGTKLDDKKGPYMTTLDKTIILIADGPPTMQKELSQLINHEADLEICIEARRTEQALDAIEKQQVDLAIINMRLEDTNSTQLAEIIRFQRPDMPLVILSTHNEHNEEEDAKHALCTQGKKCALNQEAAEQIIKAIHYVQSLLRSQIFGFTILVQIGRSV